MPTLTLKAGRDKSLRRWHPWIFSGAIQGLKGRADSGDTVTVRSAQGEFLATAAYSPHSQIRARVWSFAPEQTIDQAFFRNRLADARAYRQRLGLLRDQDSPLCRLVNAESDGLPGLIVDIYGAYCVCQFLAAGTERWKDTIAGLLEEMFHFRGIYERSDTDSREKEGLSPSTGLLRGQEPEQLLVIEENRRRYAVDIRQGHKTGWYLDQRDNRNLLADSTQQADVLNCFCYSGGFTVAALQGGARSVISVDSSAPALALARHNAELNGPWNATLDFVEADVFRLLRQYRQEGRSFDCIVLDPPKFVDSSQHLHRAARGYKDINLLAFQLLRQGGRLFTFSCSGLVGMPLFQKIVADAALDAGRPARIVRHLEQGPDHPTSLAFPEAGYLTGLLCQV